MEIHIGQSSERLWETGERFFHDAKDNIDKTVIFFVIEAYYTTSTSIVAKISISLVFGATFSSYILILIKFTTSVLIQKIPLIKKHFPAEPNTSMLMACPMMSAELF